jgi:hypothetical protein
MLGKRKYLKVWKNKNPTSIRFQHCKNVIKAVETREGSVSCKVNVKNQYSMKKTMVYNVKKRTILSAKGRFLNMPKDI